MKDLASLVTQLNNSSAQTLADLEQAQRSIATTVQQVQRAAFLAQYDQVALQEFFTKPYVVRPLGADEYRIDRSEVHRLAGRLAGAHGRRFLDLPRQPFHQPDQSRAAVAGR